MMSTRSRIQPYIVLALFIDFILYLWWTHSLNVIETSLHIQEMYRHLDLLPRSRQKKTQFQELM